MLNGQPKLIERLKTAGIDEINVSLHSLDQKEFQNITGINSLTTVLEGIKYAVSHGVKTNINCLIREKTADELDSYITLSRELKIRVKFFGLIDETGINQKYLDNLLDNFRCLLDKK